MGRFSEKEGVEEERERHRREAEREMRKARFFFILATIGAVIAAAGFILEVLK